MKIIKQDTDKPAEKLGQAIVKSRASSSLELAQPNTALILVLMAAFLALFFAPAFNSSAQFLYRDTGRTYEPMKRYIAQELMQGRFPAWNPYSGLGTPLVGGAIDAVQHPFNFLLLLPSFDLGFKLWVLLSFLLATMSAFAWARVLGLSRLAAMGAGLAFGISGFLASQSSNLQYLTTYAGLPLVFAATHAWIIDCRPGRLALVAGASALCASGGDPQSWIIAMFSMPAYAIVVSGLGNRRRAILRGLLAMVAGMIAASPFILPVIAWLPHSSRTQILLPADYERWNLHPLRLFEMIVPHIFQGDPAAIYNPVFSTYVGNEWTLYPWAQSIYLGITCLAFAIAGASRVRNVRWLIAAAGVFTWMAMGPYGGFWDIAKHVPVVGNFRYGEKLLVWPTLFISIASGFGIDALIENRRIARPMFWGASTAGAIFFLVAILLAVIRDSAIGIVERGSERQVAEVLLSNLTAGLLHVGVACILLAVGSLVIARLQLTRAAPYMLVLVLLVDISVANHSAYVLSNKLHWRYPPLSTALGAPDDLKRVIVPFGPNVKRWQRLSEWENELQWYERILDYPLNVPARVGNLRPYVGMIQDRMNRYEKATSFTPVIGAGLWGVSSVVVLDTPEAAAQVKVPPPYHILGSDPELPAYAVEIPHRPRAYLATSLINVDESEALMFVLSPEAVSSGIVVIENPVPQYWRPPKGDVRIIHDEPCATVLEVHSDTRALLVLNDAFAPGWSATIDGHAANIQPANYLARGVWVDAGIHIVKFKFQTPFLREGWVLSGLGACALCGWVVVRRRFHA